MNSNRQPDAIYPLFTLGGDCCGGLHNHGVALNVLHNPEAIVRAILDSAKAAQKAYKKKDAAATLLNQAVTNGDATAKVFLGAARKIIALAYGEHWSKPWETAGFASPSTAVPTTQEERLALLDSLDTFFTDNPGLEINTPQLVVTATKAMLLFQAGTQARIDAAEGETLAGQLKIPRDAAVVALRHQLTSLVTELGDLLDPLDPLWTAFGLNKPGATNLPGDITDLKLTPGAAGSLLVTWQGGANGTHFRIFLLVEGVDPAPVFLGNTTDPIYNFTGLPSGKKVTVQIIAANDAGQGAAATADYVVP